MHTEKSQIDFTVNGKKLSAADGVTVAAALMSNGILQFRKSATGESRGPVCGMGICFECTVTINGRPHQRACQVLVARGMEVATNG
ncbi:MAG TPA: (2Fe-2S)-binding protein [Phycisphaerae bacterium]|nr:(2Fe-2S)-binding protein [Phycisphaerae bacterium]